MKNGSKRLRPERIWKDRPDEDLKTNNVVAVQKLAEKKRTKYIQKTTVMGSKQFPFIAPLKA